MRVAITATAVTAIVIGAVPCLLLWFFAEPDDQWGDAHRVLARVKACAGMAALLATVLALVTVGLRRRAAHLASVATTPLPPHSPDPLATYRETTAKCPRHPFAR